MLSIKYEDTWHRGFNTCYVYVGVLALRVLAEMHFPEWKFADYLEENSFLDLKTMMDDLRSSGIDIKDWYYNSLLTFLKDGFTDQENKLD